jgi:hypothetical protein
MKRDSEMMGRNDGVRAIRNKGDYVERKPLTPWETYVQALFSRTKLPTSTDARQEPVTSPAELPDKVAGFLHDFCEGACVQAGAAHQRTVDVRFGH